MSKPILTEDRAFYYVQIAGTLTIMLLGICAAIALVLAALWVCAQFLLLVVNSLVEFVHEIELTWLQADSFTRLVALVLLTLAIRWLISKRKGTRI